MIVNRTYFNKDNEKEIDNILGKSFSFLRTLKLRGNKVSDVNYCNIELRPKGIIVNITQQLNLFSITIPYYKLVIFNSETFSIHLDGSFIKILKDKNYLNNKKFIKKMMNLKNYS